MLLWRHLLRHQEVNLATMILVVGETLIYLGSGEHRETGRRHALDAFAVLLEAITSCTAIRVLSTRAVPPRTSGVRTMYRYDCDVSHMHGSYEVEAENQPTPSAASRLLDTMARARVSCTEAVS